MQKSVLVSIPTLIVGDLENDKNRQDYLDEGKLFDGGVIIPKIEEGD